MRTSYRVAVTCETNELWLNRIYPHNRKQLWVQRLWAFGGKSFDDATQICYFRRRSRLLQHSLPSWSDLCARLNRDRLVWVRSGQQLSEFDRSDQVWFAFFLYPIRLTVDQIWWSLGRIGSGQIIFRRIGSEKTDPSAQFWDRPNPSPSFKLWRRAAYRQILRKLNDEAKTGQTSSFGE